MILVLDAEMRTLSVQLHPARAARLSVASVVRLFADIAAKDPAVRRFEVQRGTDRGPYVNIHFIARKPDIARLWAVVHKRVLRHRTLGPGIRRSCMVMCEGSRGWDNYLLLYHFNDKVPVDVLRSV